ncbi:hypothetical protein K523DRAFT_325684 [Schizophyllum commune Tattone D]|nr:hypothetical protein K523DRAFT_325684 [Schizophyllum commune Tattone D]
MAYSKDYTDYGFYGPGTLRVGETYQRTRTELDFEENHRTASLQTLLYLPTMKQGLVADETL